MSTTRLPRTELIANVRKLAPSWGGTLTADMDHGYASFTRTIDVGDFGGATRCTVGIDCMVEFDPDTGKPRDEPAVTIDINGLDRSETYLPLAALPKLLNTLGELAAAAGFVADWKEARHV
ncbi:hypothetical protein [Acidipropionibacterium jensenii]|uniref:hypothetical protein n=1 Tax=Acidipropionibacterium jensenii TaxID=1749 RepID=UPI0026475C11|nr:hypothetical protein [Acidipropionibacterium jensenii]MDN6556373.1 hypothetical protein [Acidipropionibacterium acidipropionici]MDN5977990.1 hypothetical protein [Acidipropionibacterium jensenii]MDN5996794.1 hypothetical protein [Acidipropionibacterium jensenii]MDN6427409.1 hypothetical protein [Acidipropionibacterium jensenii]MDN6442443.1 hypothetical protein [Acidipropionibacterium jensenii]